MPLCVQGGGATIRLVGAPTLLPWLKFPGSHSTLILRADTAYAGQPAPLKLYSFLVTFN